MKTKRVVKKRASYSGRVSQGKKTKPKQCTVEARKHKANILQLRQAYMEVFEILGGVEEFARWAAKDNKNQTEFYKQMSKMLPRELQVRDPEVSPSTLSHLKEEELDAIIADIVKGR